MGVAIGVLLPYLMMVVSLLVKPHGYPVLDETILNDCNLSRLRIDQVLWYLSGPTALALLVVVVFVSALQRVSVVTTLLASILVLMFLSGWSWLTFSDFD